MTKESAVARFLNARINASGRLQREIAAEVGFESPNIITMIKQGDTKLPLDKVGSIARALETDPVQLLKMCLEEYYPNTWAATADHFEVMLTSDEIALIRAMRTFVGSPYLSAIDDRSKERLNLFLDGLKQHAATLQ